MTPHVGAYEIQEELFSLLSSMCPRTSCTSLGTHENGLIAVVKDIKEIWYYLNTEVFCSVGDINYTYDNL